MKLKDVLDIENGIFTNMPQDIWGELFESSDLDLEFYVRYGDREASKLVKALVKDGELDIVRLSRMVYAKQKRSLAQAKEAFYLEYDLRLSGGREELETHTITEEITGTDGESIKNSGTQKNVKDGNTTLTKNGVINRELEGNDIYDITDAENTTTQGKRTSSGADSEIIDLDKNVNLDRSGIDTETQETNNTTTVKDSLEKKGSESTTGTDKLTRNLKSTTDGITDLTSQKDNTGTQKNENIQRVNGFGSTTPVNANSTDDNRTDNLKEKVVNNEVINNTTTDSGTENRENANTLSFTGRIDATDRSETIIGENINKTNYGSKEATVDKTLEKRDIDYGKIDDLTDSVTGEIKKTGTIGKSDRDRTTFENYSEKTLGVDTDVRTDDLESIRDLATKRDKFYEDIRQLSVESDSPLQTNVDAIIEELKLRELNFTDYMFKLVSADVCTSVMGVIYI